jgi:serine/threonine protein phosphatase PrpC
LKEQKKKKQGFNSNEFTTSYCAQHLVELLEAELLCAGTFTQQVFVRVFAALNAAVCEETTGGCTAVVAVSCAGQLYVANAGDARAVLVRKGSKVKERKEVL